MNKAEQKIRTPGGFTLIEVLIAVAIFAVVLGAINTVFFSALKLRNKTSELLDKSLPLEQAVTIIERDLRSIVPPDGPMGGQLQTLSTTNSMAGMNGPVFYCASGIVDETSPWSEVQKVSYMLAESTNRFGGRDLLRVTSRNILAAVQEEPMTQWLLGGVDQITFTYFDGTTWMDTWDSTTQDPKLPKAIKVQIQRTPEQTERMNPALNPIEIVAPVMAQAKVSQSSTNSVEQ